MFLFAAPEYLSTIPCTISPISFTNNMTPSYSSSVASVKFLMSQNPKMQMTFYPGNIGLISSPPDMFFAIIEEPASPNPRARSPPILMSVYSSITVSSGASFDCFFLVPSSYCSMINCSFSSSCWAFKGFSEIRFTFVIISSIGVITISWVTLDKINVPAPSTKTTKMVVQIDSIA